MCQLLLFCLNLFVFISALKINNFAALGKKKNKLHCCSISALSGNSFRIQDTNRIKFIFKKPQSHTVSIF